MPELPEVETVRAGLAESLTQAKVTDVLVHDARSLRRHNAGSKDFISTLTGKTIEAAVRRGKFLWLPLGRKRGEPQLALMGHLGMSGQILLRSPDFEAEKLNRVTIKVKTAEREKLELRFVDQRIFGSLAIDVMEETQDRLPGGFAGTKDEYDWLNLIPSQAKHIARDPLDPSFDLDWVLKKFKSKDSGIKRVLLDQQVVSGIGNIYADESLWRARVHYDQPAATISTKKALALMAEVTEVLAAAVEAGGTSFDEQYKNINGESGYFSVSLNAYGMTGLPCNRCGRAIRRDAWMNRGSHFCPNCQKLRVSNRAK
ncbi:MAG: bifunctional DNA-formamidopyrimidine glycosylase/DNA-(apurinic or apyrimidinic site) lyase [Micrococcales bacterium]|nr:bifunctional DNA-formamidopyrimidine glycosylase/DNA-(apurinic or apyrimidinic site) lyase [Micrococcales bacterium]